MTFPPGRPLAVIMAYRGEDPARPCGLAWLADPRRAEMESHDHPWGVLRYQNAWRPAAGLGEWRDAERYEAGDTELRVVTPGASVLVIEAPTWSAARGELARMLIRSGDPGLYAVQEPARPPEIRSGEWRTRAWSGSLEAAVLDAGAYARTGIHEELPPDEREHYDGPYARVPALSYAEALDMIDAAIVAAEGGSP